MDVAVLSLAVAVLAGVGVAACFNALADRRQAVRDAWAVTDAALRRRADLLPPLAAAVRDTADPSPPALAAALAARNRAAVAFNPDQLADAERTLSAHLRELLKSPPPSWTARPALARHRSDLSAADAALTAAGQRYNDAVADYNAALNAFPTEYVARPFGFRPQPPFHL